MKRLLVYLALLPFALLIAAVPGKVLAWALLWLFLTAVILFVVWGYFSNQRMKREKLAKTYSLRFVYIEDNGSPRVLTPEEVNYLNTEFHPADGARPYIKHKYAQRTPDGRISGFLLKTKLPRALRSQVSAGVGAGDA